MIGTLIARLTCVALSMLLVHGPVRAESTRTEQTVRQSAAAGVRGALDEAGAPEAVEIGQFGQYVTAENFVAIQWENPRDVCEVHILGVDPPVAESLRLEWWGSVWPANGTGGWMRLDDPWNGQWVRTEAEPEPAEAGRYVFKFPPLTKAEWGKALDAEQYPEKKKPIFRRALKVRVVADGQTSGAPPPFRVAKTEQRRLLVFGRSRWAEATFDVRTQHTHDGTVTGRIEVTNGVALDMKSLPEPRSGGAPQVSQREWKARGVAGSSSGVRAKIRYADNDDLSSNDLTRITVRLGDDPDAAGFSFVPQDVLRDGPMWLPDFATLVSEGSQCLTLANYSNPISAGQNSVRQELRGRPEMTRAMAMQGIPRLSPPRWVPLGVPSARQEFFVGPNGDWMISALSLNTDSGRDAKRWVFKKDFGRQRQWDEFFALLDTRPEPKFDGTDRESTQRYLEDGHLPLIHVKWHSEALRYHHSLLATVLEGDYGDDPGVPGRQRAGDETTVLLSRLQVTNDSNSPQPATVNLRYSLDAPLSLKHDGLIAVQARDPAPIDPVARVRLKGQTIPSPPDNWCGAAKGLPAWRGQISMDEPAGGGAADWIVQESAQDESGGSGKAGSLPILRWQVTLEPKQTRRIYFKTPFVELLDAEELAALKAMDFEREAQRILTYWRNRLAAGMRIDVPDEALNNFYKANLWHNVITTDRDPVTGLYNQGVATVRYRVFANETVMVARSMDMRGEHTEAERFLEPLLTYQSNEPLKGRFSTQEGVFHSAGDYTHGEYAMNHGFVLWGVADHYLMTGDRAYLNRVAPQLIKGCDFLIAERARTMTQPGLPRSPTHGLSPASSLEDVVEYQYWFATNAYFYLGIKRVAQALSDIKHPQAGRIADEAEKYRRDIEAAVREAATESAVVRLRNGSTIPYVPSRVYQWRHLTEGWIREALYCSLHLATAEVLSPSDPIITWMLDDLEDNIFFSRQSGYNVTDLSPGAPGWFERGGVTLQPCLLDTPMVYMARDEIAAALRAFFNTYALSIYPDVHCFAEWAPRFGVAGGPVYKTSDESRFVMWLRQLLVWEDGDRLWLARGVPREWLQHGKVIRVHGAPSLFGVVEMTIRSEADRGRIHASVVLPQRKAPKQVWLRLWHPVAAVPKCVFIDGRVVEPSRLVGTDIRLVPGAEITSGAIKIVAEY